METEKICRTCLGLTGPLMSIFDGGSIGGLCDMLACFTVKPRQDDNMPDKVCLNCISEVNRCYSFKLKCENSDRTLRQLLPDALPDDQSNKLDKPMVSKAIQTDAECSKQVVSTSMQTMKEQEEKPCDQFVQTDADTCGVETLPYSEEYVESSKNPEQIKIESRRLKTKSAKSESPHLVLKRRRLECYDNSEDQNENEIILEVHSEDQPAFVDGNENEDGATHYEITKACSDDEEITESHGSGAQEAVSYNVTEDEDFTHLIYAAEQISEAAPQDNLNFTIYKNELGETEVVPQQRHDAPTKPATRSKQSGPRKKQEIKCPKCVMTFISMKYLGRHLFRRHTSTESATGKENTANIKRETATGKVNNMRAVKKPSVDSKLIPTAENERVATIITEDVKTTLPPPPQNLYQCDKCNAVFALRKSLTYHQKQNVCSQVSFKCDKCDRVFISEQKLEEHKQATHVVITCTECNKTFATADELSKHMIDDHNRNLRNQCGVCKKVFTMFSALKEHFRIHSGEKPFTCDICGKSFSQSANLRQHKLRHSKEKKFKCDECSNAYVTKAELFSHKRTHTRESPFKCEFCNAQFTTSSSLNKHRRRHTGERPYACEICPMRFSALNVLKNHRRTHTGEKPYRCNYCYKSFSQKGDCQTHQRSHTGDRRHVCSCGESFTHLSTLRHHRKTHEQAGEKHTQVSTWSNADDTKEKPMQITIVKANDDEEDEELMQITVDDGTWKGNSLK